MEKTDVISFLVDARRKIPGMELAEEEELIRAYTTVIQDLEVFDY